MNYLYIIITQVTEIADYSGESEGLSDENQVNKHTRSVAYPKHYVEIGFPGIREESQCSEDQA